MPDFVAPEVKKFVPWDYVVFAALFLVSASIGVFFAVKERKKKTSKEFLVGGRQMTCGPIAFSLTSSFMSAVTVLGTPSEVYRYGASFVLFFLSYTLVIIFTAELFLPVFYRSGITSTYEYLELRFNKIVRLAATLIYILQTLFCCLPDYLCPFTNDIVLFFGFAVTGFDLWGSVAATGIVCTFYCTLGGLKAVVWTDAFQMVVMVAGFVTVLIRGTSLNGGSTKVWEDAHAGSRLNIFDFDADPLRRHTIWTIVIGGTFTWLGIYGVNQSTIQRCISCKSERHAKLALYLNLLGLWTVLVCAVFCGLVMYSHYKSCDPWTAGFISAPDQLMPYFVMDIFSSMPGVPGLLVACAFSGTLSTVAASINALATVTFEDLVKKGFPNLSEKMSTWISKALCVLYGVLCTSMAAAASLLGGVVQASLSIHGMCGGPMLGLFTLGILFPCANWKGAVAGLLAGLSVAFWAGTGSFLYPSPPAKALPLPLATLNCSVANSTALLPTAPPTLPPHRPWLADAWYSLSYLYFSAVGCVCCALTGLLISFLTGPNKGEDIPPVLIKPICNLFCFWSQRLKILLWCGVQHDNNISKGNPHQIPGYNPEENSYTNMSRETRL
uniref:Solute carrier family 5 member 12 n=1 Tax=Malurus cyaneus samueli TaxID=2593467 RepID=A0A8C5TNB8_9PASS